MWVIALHFGAGAVAGAIFNVRTLIALVALVAAECIAVAAASGLSAALLSAGGLVAVQVGYLVGIYLRSVLERAGLAHPSIRPEHQR
ncbi:hypothetical protein HL667_24835 [Bradyrhizobium sp. 83012]|uniref:Uncharacterized protein n=1 Tax=Bradyrhizobium aeschynomenes TaxID=2734909 RepID=A0ABX2CJ80_9BRAD|nr:hypothetical protein [Bradyrhizobium aeschynomenes]NPU15394.1 hypothetical protein [Bradyrhizobium aeschynomenes]NPU68249.1 hypothetical protein [Bradyrhizobium aeschynomenes]NPV25587.1 hypothetical protein [Bradyrhizobium aeschynomenes]